MGKKYTADDFVGALTGTASGNVAKTGNQSMTGTLTVDTSASKVLLGGNAAVTIHDSGSSSTQRLEVGQYYGIQNYTDADITVAARYSNGFSGQGRINLIGGLYGSPRIAFKTDSSSTPGPGTNNAYVGFAGGSISDLRLQYSAANATNNIHVRNDSTYFDQPIRIGANSSANELDDYEEGTWTPALYNTSGIGVGYNSQQAEYIKVGRIVHIKGYISVQSMGYNSSNGTFGMNVPFGVDTTNGIAYGIFQPTTNKFVTNGSTGNFKDTYNVKLKFQGSQASLQCKFELPSSSYGGSTTDANGNFLPSGSGSNGATFYFSAVYTSQT